MGFYGKAFDNGLQAKAAGSKPILFPANQNLGRSGLYHSWGRFSMCSPPFDRSPSRCSHRWFEPIFSILALGHAMQGFQRPSYRKNGLI